MKNTMRSFELTKVKCCSAKSFKRKQWWDSHCAFCC